MERNEKNNFSAKVFYFHVQVTEFQIVMQVPLPVVFPVQMITKTNEILLPIFQHPKTSTVQRAYVMGHNREDPMTAPKWPQQEQQYDVGKREKNGLSSLGMG